MRAVLNVNAVKVGDPYRTNGRVVVLDDGVGRFILNDGTIAQTLTGTTVATPVPNREWIVSGLNPDGVRETWDVTADCGCGGR